MIAPPVEVDVSRRSRATMALSVSTPSPARPKPRKTTITGAPPRRKSCARSDRTAYVQAPSGTHRTADRVRPGAQRHAQDGGHDERVPQRDDGLPHAVRHALGEGRQRDRPRPGEPHHDEKPPQRRGQIARVQQGLVAEYAGRERLPRSGREHEAQDAVDHHQRQDRGDREDPGDAVVGLRADCAPRVEVQEDGHDLDEEQDPLDRPVEDELVDEHRHRPRADQGDSEPDAHARDRAQHIGHEQDQQRVLLEKGQRVGIAVAIGAAFGDGDPQPRPHGEVRDEHVHDRDDGDQHAPAQHGHVQNRVFHSRVSSDRQNG